MDTMIPRLIEPSKQSFFLFGPRGTGKTTWLRAKFPEALFIDLLESDTFRRYSAKPERLRELIDGNPGKKIIVIDEIQKIPDLLSEVHSLIERKKGLRFILTGSSSRKLKRSGTDLLAGRALHYYIYPFTAAELGGAFDFESALQTGLVPLVMCADEPSKVLKSYITLYIREEVQMEGLVRNIGNFSRFLEAASFSHGSVLNITNIARDCEVERKAVEGYIGILEDLMLACRVPVFNKRAKRAVTAHPKFYFFDTGVFRSLRPCGPLDDPQAIGGAALEGLVFQHLAAWNAYQGGKNKLYFWRTSSGTEVDFVVYGPGAFYAIEVKNTDKITGKDFTGLISFKEDYPQSKPLLLYRGKERRVMRGVLCMPCEDFLKKGFDGFK